MRTHSRSRLRRRSWIMLSRLLDLRCRSDAGRRGRRRDRAVRLRGIEGSDRYRRRRLRPRWTRTAKTRREQPSTSAASAEVRLSQANSSIASRSAGESCSSAAQAVSRMSISPVGSAKLAFGCPTRRAARASRRDEDRRLFASTLRATPSSQGRAGSGISPNRRHAMAKVSATTSSAVSASLRRSA